MEKYSEADIDALLKQIRDKVDSQSANDTPESDKNAVNENLDVLIDQIKANIDDDVVVSVENEEEKEDYDISGYEIESEPESSEISLEESVEELVDEIPDDVNENDLETVEEIEEITETAEIEPEEIDENADFAGFFEELSVLQDEEPVSEDSDCDNEQMTEGAKADINEGSTYEVIEEEADLNEEPICEVVDEEAYVAEESTANEVIEEICEQVLCETPDPVEEVLPVDDFNSLVGDRYEEITSAFSVNGDGKVASDMSHRFELDESDINVAISLGSKGALEDSLGFVKVREAKSNFIDPTARKTLSSLIFTRRNNEYKGDNSSQIKGEYRKEKKRIARRFIFTALILLVTVFSEVIYYSPVRVPFINDVFDMPYAYRTLSTVLLVCAVLISARKIVYGVSGFLSTRPNYYTTIGMIVSVNLIYSIVTIALDGEGMLIFTSSTIIALVFGVIGEYLYVSREMLTFDIISNDKPKLSLERQERTIETVKTATYLNSREFFVENTNFVGKYFERTAKLPTFYYVDYIYNVVFSMLSLIVAVFVMVYTKNLTYAVLSFSLLLTVSIPLQREFHTALPLYIIARKLYKHDSAIIGESVIDEYVGRNTIYLDETEVFGRYGVKVTNLKTYNNFNVVDINYYYVSLFSQISGPLKYAFGDESKKIKISDDIKLLNVYDGGIEACVDGTNKVYVGTYDFFMSHNIVSRLPEERKFASEEYVTMYMSVNGALCAELQLKYSIDKHFEVFAEDMASSGASVGVRTIDPNVNEEMIKRIRKNDADTIKVTRPTLNDIVPIGKRSDSGIITCKNHHMIPRILDLCLSVRKIKSTQTFIWLAYSIISLLSIALTAFLGILEYVSPLYIIAYEAMWTVLVIGYVVNKLKTGNKNG